MYFLIVPGIVFYKVKFTYMLQRTFQISGKIFKLIPKSPKQTYSYLNKFNDLSPFFLHEYRRKWQMNPTNYSELFILRRVCSAQLFAYNYIAFSLFQITMNPPVSECQHLALQNCLLNSCGSK